MAYEDRLALLRKGVDVWNPWRGKDPSINPDLRWAKLDVADVRIADLRGALAGGADLSRADLGGACLDQATLYGQNSWRRTSTRRTSARRRLGHRTPSHTLRGRGFSPSPMRMCGCLGCSSGQQSSWPHQAALVIVPR
jgi:Pentapeptide repeats (8 copies)